VIPVYSYKADWRVEKCDENGQHFNKHGVDMACFYCPIWNWNLYWDRMFLGLCPECSGHLLKHKIDAACNDCGYTKDL